MSKPIASALGMHLAQFSGGAHRGVCVQFEVLPWREGSGMVQLSQTEATWLVENLTTWLVEQGVEMKCSECEVRSEAILERRAAESEREARADR